MTGASVDRWDDWDWAGARRSCLQVARRRLPPQAAEDVVQEALARGWNSRHQPEGTDLMPWLVTITKNECSRYWRRESNRPLDLGLDDLGGGEPHEDLTFWDGVAERIMVCQAIARLTDADRHLIGLRYHRHLSQREIATTIRVPEGTVASKLHRARDQLRRLLVTERERYVQPYATEDDRPSPPDHDRSPATTDTADVT